MVVIGTGRAQCKMDDYMAWEAEAALYGIGAEVLGPCPNKEATQRVRQATPTAVVLDLNWGPTFEIARLLTKRRVPLVFFTSYDPDVIPEELVDLERL